MNSKMSDYDINDYLSTPDTCICSGNQECGWCIKIQELLDDLETMRDEIELDEALLVEYADKMSDIMTYLATQWVGVL